MKKIFFRTAVVAVVALALMCGSALAGSIGIEGEIAFTGGRMMLLDATGAVTNDFYQAHSLSFLADVGGVGFRVNLFEGDFANVTHPNQWGIYDDVPFLLTDNQLLVRNPGYSHGLPLYAQPAWSFADGAEYVFGTIGAPNTNPTYTFAIDTIDGFTNLESFNGSPTGLTTSSFTLNAHGYVYDNDGTESYGLWLLKFSRTNSNYEWGFGGTFQTVGTDPDPIPEPGTLLLLGSGLLGATIVARRKMNKK